MGKRLVIAVDPRITFIGLKNWLFKTGIKWTKFSKMPQCYWILHNLYIWQGRQSLHIVIPRWPNPVTYPAYCGYSYFRVPLIPLLSSKLHFRSAIIVFKILYLDNSGFKCHLSFPLQCFVQYHIVLGGAITIPGDRLSLKLLFQQYKNIFITIRSSYLLH